MSDDTFSIVRPEAPPSTKGATHLSNLAWLIDCYHSFYGWHLLFRLASPARFVTVS